MVDAAGQFMGGKAGPYADPTEASPELFQGLVNFLEKNFCDQSCASVKVLLKS